jgi:hypothetical protein
MFPIPAILWLLIPALFGISLVLRLRLVPEKVAALVIGTTFGLTTFVTAAYVLTLNTNLAGWLPRFFLLLTAAIIPALWLKNRQAARAAWQDFKQLPLDRGAAGVLIGTGLLFSILAPKLLITDTQGLTTVIVNAYGDIAWHLATITQFVAGQSIPPENPIFAGTKLLYPFLTNFQSALMLAQGGSLSDSINLQAWVMIPLLLSGIYCLARSLTLNRLAAGLTTLLFLGGGATLGWLHFAPLWRESGLGLGEFLLHLPFRDFSGAGADPDGFHFLNATTSLLLPQRTFLMAFLLATSILTLLLSGSSATRRSRFVIAGVLAGLTPLFHAHSVVALFPAIVALAIADTLTHQRSLLAWSKTWLWFVVPALVLGLPEIYYYVHGSAAEGSFLRWGPGWLAGEENFIWYWFKNTGLLLPAVVVGFSLPAPRLAKVFALVGLGLFTFANMFLLAPWAWDNFKIFVYFFLFTLPLASWVAAQYITKPRTVYLPTVVIYLVGLHLISGGLDTWKLALPTASQWPVWGKEGMAFAQEVVVATKPGERILTAPTHNSPIVLSGRARYLGYSAHVWSHGGYPWVREEAIADFYNGLITTLPEATVQYVLVGPQERHAYPDLVIQPDWHLVLDYDQYQLYRLPTSPSVPASR